MPVIIELNTNQNSPNCPTICYTNILKYTKTRAPKWEKGENRIKILGRQTFQAFSNFATVYDFLHSFYRCQKNIGSKKTYKLRKSNLSQDASSSCLRN